MLYPYPQATLPVQAPGCYQLSLPLLLLLLGFRRCLNVGKTGGGRGLLDCFRWQQWQQQPATAATAATAALGTAAAPAQTAA